MILKSAIFRDKLLKPLLFTRSAAKKDILLIDSSTIDPFVSQTIGKNAARSGVGFIDCPVSGGKLLFRALSLKIIFNIACVIESFFH